MYAGKKLMIIVLILDWPSAKTKEGVRDVFETATKAALLVNNENPNHCCRCIQ